LGEDILEDCKENLKKLIGKKIFDVEFKFYDDDRWRIHLDTEDGKFVMTFCKSWTCPIVEHRGKNSSSNTYLDSETLIFFDELAIKWYEM